MVSKYLLCMDVGGTEIKAAILKQDIKFGVPKLVHKFITVPSLAKQSKEKIIENFIQIIEQAATNLPDFAKLSGIGFAFPGPFDYENGISRMQNISKYDSIYGISLRKEFQVRMRKSALLRQFADVPICFVNDVAAFALGELNYGVAMHVKKAMFVCIGTGCGSAFSLCGKLVGEEIDSVPRNGYIYSHPFLEGCIDDYISKRGLENLTKKRMGKSYDGLELSHLVKEGNEEAKECFLEFGNYVKEALEPYLDRFQPDCFVMGGQIIKSAELFLKEWNDCCERKKIPLYLRTETSFSSIQGITMLF